MDLHVEMPHLVRKAKGEDGKQMQLGVCSLVKVVNHVTMCKSGADRWEYGALQQAH